jgi:hypothetical protein
VLFGRPGRCPEGFAFFRKFAELDEIEAAWPAGENAQQMLAVRALPPVHLPPDFHGLIGLQAASQKYVCVTRLRNSMQFKGKSLICGNAFELGHF